MGDPAGSGLDVGRLRENIFMSDDAASDLRLPWLSQCIGGGIIAGTHSSMRLSFPGAGADAYTDAEVNDYQGSRRFVWRPPLRMLLHARASHPAANPRSPELEGDFLLGTAGFGFWNAPFILAKRATRLPNAIWFLYTSPPTRLCLVPDIPGYGWKAQVVHTHRLGALASLAPTVATVLWARITGSQKSAAHWVQRLSGAHEALLASDCTLWHEYRLDWTDDVAVFFLDGEQICSVPHPPHGPLGFVAWIDNQYVVATPRGEFRSGILPTGPQWLELSELAITPVVTPCTG